MNQKMWFYQLRNWLYKMWVFTGFIALIAVASGAHVRVIDTDSKKSERSGVFLKHTDSNS